MIKLSYDHKSSSVALVLTVRLDIGPEYPLGYNLVIPNEQVRKLPPEKIIDDLLQPLRKRAIDDLKDFLKDPDPPTFYTRRKLP